MAKFRNVELASKYFIQLYSIKPILLSFIMKFRLPSLKRTSFELNVCFINQSRAERSLHKYNNAAQS